MKSKEFESFLRQLQEEPYRWPDLYLAWEKPDGTLFMASTQTSQYNQLLVYETDSFLEANRARFIKDTNLGGRILDDDERIYSAHFYDINPKVSHMRGPHEFDPVEEFVSKVSEYTFLGSWNNPERYRKDHINGQVLNIGCWFEALQNIRQQERKPSLAETIESAGIRARAQQASQILPEEEIMR